MYIAHFEYIKKEPERMYFTSEEKIPVKMEFKAENKEPIRFVIGKDRLEIV